MYKWFVHAFVLTTLERSAFWDEELDQDDLVQKQWGPEPESSSRAWPRVVSAP